MSLVPTDKPEDTPLHAQRDWGRFGAYAAEDGDLIGDDRLSPELSRKTILWLSGLLVAILAGAITVQMIGGNGNPTWLVLLMVGVIGLTLLWRNLEWGIVGYIMTAWMVVGTPDVAQGSSGGQKVMVSQAGLVVLLLIWGMHKVLSQKLSLYKTPVNIPIFAYLAFAAWSTINSIMFPNHDVLVHSPKTFIQVNILEYGIRFLALIGLLMLGDVLHGKYIRYAAYALMIPGVATFSGILWFIPYTSYQAFAQILCLAILVAFTLMDKGALWQRLLAGAIALAIFGVYFIRDAEWVSGWLGALVAIILIGWRANRRLLFTSAAVIAVIVAANFPYFYDRLYVSNFYTTRVRRIDKDILAWKHFHHGQVRRIFEEQGEVSNDRSRMLYASTIYASHFPLGIGLGNYRAYNMWFGRPENWDTSTFTSAHGTYAQVISETGWGGFFLFMLLLYTNSSLMNKVYKELPEGRWKIFTLGSWGGCIGIYVSSFNGDYFFPAYHNGGLSSFGACVYTHLIIGIVIAIAREKGITWTGKPAPKVKGSWPTRDTIPALSAVDTAAEKES